MVLEINSTSFCEGFYKFAEGSERHLFLNRDIPIIGVDPYYVIKSIIDELYKMDS